MQWQQARQAVLAENIANADTPGYEAQEMATPDFKEMLQQQRRGGQSSGALKQTNKMHIQVGQANGGLGETQNIKSWEVTPSGNSVVLEDEMMKLAENQIDYQTTTALYSKSIRLLKTALGK